MEPTVIKDADGEVVISAIQTYGETIHMFVERKNYKGISMPGFVSKKSNVSRKKCWTEARGPLCWQCGIRENE
jgi:hypothetical protein